MSESPDSELIIEPGAMGLAECLGRTERLLASVQTAAADYYNSTPVLDLCGDFGQDGQRLSWPVRIDTSLITGAWPSGSGGSRSRGLIMVSISVSMMVRCRCFPEEYPLEPTTPNGRLRSYSLRVGSRLPSARCAYNERIPPWCCRTMKLPRPTGREE